MPRRYSIACRRSCAPQRSAASFGDGSGVDSAETSERGASYSRYEVSAQLDILERLVETHRPSVIAFSDPLFGSNRRWLDGFLDGVEEREIRKKFRKHSVGL